MPLGPLPSHNIESFSDEQPSSSPGQLPLVPILACLISLICSTVLIAMCVCLPREKSSGLPTSATDKTAASHDPGVKDTISNSYASINTSSISWLPKLVSNVRRSSKRLSRQSKAPTISFVTLPHDPAKQASTTKTAESSRSNYNSHQIHPPNRRLPPIPHRNAHLQVNSSVNASTSSLTSHLYDDLPPLPIATPLNQSQQAPTQTVTRHHSFQLRSKVFGNLSFCSSCQPSLADSCDDVNSEIDPLYSTIRRRQTRCTECGAGPSLTSTPSVSLRGSIRGPPISSVPRRLTDGSVSSSSPRRPLRHHPYPISLTQLQGAKSGTSTPSNHLYARLIRPGNDPRAHSHRSSLLSLLYAGGSLGGSDWSLGGSGGCKPSLPIRGYGLSEIDLIEKLRSFTEAALQESAGEINSSEPQQKAKKSAILLHSRQRIRSSQPDIACPDTCKHHFNLANSLRQNSYSDDQLCVAPPSRVHWSSPSHTTQDSMTAHLAASISHAHDNPAFISGDEEPCRGARVLVARRKLKLDLSLLSSGGGDRAAQQPESVSPFWTELQSLRHMDSDLDLAASSGSLSHTTTDHAHTCQRPPLMTPLMERSMESSIMEGWMTSNATVATSLQNTPLIKSLTSVTEKEELGAPSRLRCQSLSALQTEEQSCGGVFQDQTKTQLSTSLDSLHLNPSARHRSVSSQALCQAIRPITFSTSPQQQRRKTASTLHSRSSTNSSSAYSSRSLPDSHHLYQSSSGIETASWKSEMVSPLFLPVRSNGENISRVIRHPLSGRSSEV